MLLTPKPVRSSIVAWIKPDSLSKTPEFKLQLKDGKSHKVTDMLCAAFYVCDKQSTCSWQIENVSAGISDDWDVWLCECHQGQLVIFWKITIELMVIFIKLFISWQISDSDSTLPGDGSTAPQLTSGPASEGRVYWHTQGRAQRWAGRAEQCSVHVSKIEGSICLTSALTRVLCPDLGPWAVCGSWPHLSNTPLCQVEELRWQKRLCIVPEGVFYQESSSFSAYTRGKIQVFLDADTDSLTTDKGDDLKLQGKNITSRIF